MSKHTRTPRGPHRKEAAFKHEHIENEAVREMASQFEKLSDTRDGAIGPEIPFRVPRSVGEAKYVMGKLREKAEERLDDLPKPVQKAIHLGENVLGLMLVPVRFGVRLVRDVLSVPVAMLRILTRQEA